ncbi:MAG: 3-phosphoshikimate 1-carboxyvinyltransferase [Asticcacaulis sp.]
MSANLSDHPDGTLSETLRSAPGAGLKGRVRAPGDKSMSHRAMIFGGLAKGRTEVTGLLEGDDVMRTKDAMVAFGARITRLGEGHWEVEGQGTLTTPTDVVDCGNAGTGVRLLMGAAAGYDLRVTFDGDSSLRKRPMGRVTEPLEAMGARFETQPGGRVPLTLTGGSLRGIRYTLPMASAQVKSAVLLAGLNADGPTEVVEPEPSRDHTELMLKAFGADLRVETTEDGGRIIRLQPSPLSASRVTVAGDPSSAAFPLVAALITPGSEVTVEGVLLNPLRIGLIHTLLEMGADLTIANQRESGGEQIGDITARYSALKGVTVPPERAPAMIDEYPILAVAAAFATGETIMRGIGEMRVKESDRIALMVAGLRACGVEIAEEPEGMIVTGIGTPPAGGASVTTRGDHRIAMSHLVLGLAAQNGVQVDEPGMIATSFPTFVTLMQGLGADLSAG